MGFVLDVQPRSDLAFRRAQLCPAIFRRETRLRWFLDRNRPAQHAGIEGRKLTRIGCTDRYRRDVQPRWLRHPGLLRNRRRPLSVRLDHEWREPYRPVAR